MPVYKNEKNGTWYAMIRYKDWTGTNRQKCHEGMDCSEPVNVIYLDRIGIHPDFRW